MPADLKALSDSIVQGHFHVLNRRVEEAVLLQRPDFADPLTFEIMRDPVLTSDGQMYDRKNIESHFQERRREGQHLTSPLTNLIILETLTPVHIVRDGICTALKAEKEKLRAEVATIVNSW